MKKIFLVISLSLLAASAFSQTRAERKAAEAAAVMSMVNDTTYRIDVTAALPMGWNTVHLSSYYSLEVAKDTVISCLPYFGRAYSIPYGGGKGLMFDGKAKDYTVTDGKDGGKEIRFTVTNEEDRYTFSLSVYPSGTALIYVVPERRQPISYTGRVSRQTRTGKISPISFRIPGLVQEARAQGVAGVCRGAGAVPDEKKMQKSSRKVWMQRKSAYLCSPFRKRGERMR